MRKICGSIGLVLCALALAGCGGGSAGSGSGSSTTTASGDLSVSSTSVSFAAQTIGTASSAQTFTISNSTTQAITLNSITLAGTNPSQFAEATNCTTTMAAGSSCTVWTQFNPSAAAAASATVSISSNAANSPTVVTLNGAGGTASSNAANQVPIAVDAGPIGLIAAGGAATNQPYVTVTVCAPGSTSNCQVIDHVLLDTLSSGLRLLSSDFASGSSTLPAVTDANSGNPLYECDQFSAGYGWGSVRSADVILGGETADDGNETLR